MGHREAVQGAQEHCCDSRRRRSVLRWWLLPMSQFFRDVDVFNADTGAWSTTQLPPPARSFFAAGSICTKAIFGGGYIDDVTAATSVTNALAIFDTVTRVWTTGELSQPRGHFTAVSFAATVVFGGGGTGNAGVPSVDLFAACVGGQVLDTATNSCRRCGPGAFSPFGGFTACTTCTAGSYSRAAADKCSSCPPVSSALMHPELADIAGKLLSASWHG